MGQKRGFLNLFKNLVIIFYIICSIIKIYIIYCVPVQITYLGKYFFVRYRPKCFQPIILQDFLINNISRTNQWNQVGMVKNGFGQSGHRTLKLTVYLRNEKMEWTDFLHAGANSGKLKVDPMILGRVW